MEVSEAEVIPPLHLSTICSQKVPGEVQGFEYGRVENPTRTRVEKELAALERGKHATLFSSGMAAITAIFSTLKAGDHIICSENVYEGTRRLLEEIFTKFGVEVTFVRDESEIETSMKPITKLVWFESVSNPLLEIADIKRLKKICSDRCKLIIDSTFTSPFCLSPLELGADAVVHSTTKFLAGHHDMTGGVIITDDDSLQEKIKRIQQTTGSILAPFDCFLLSRGLKTLDVRMTRQCKNAKKLAKQLEQHPGIKKVIFPGLKSHPQHELAQKQMQSSGSIITVVLEDENKFFNNLRIAKASQSLGGFSTIIQVPRKMMDFAETAEELDEKGVTENLIRISVGLEDVEDLIEDFQTSSQTQ